MFAVSAPSPEKQSEHEVKKHGQYHVVNAKHQSTVVADVGLEVWGDATIDDIHVNRSEPQTVCDSGHDRHRNQPMPPLREPRRVDDVVIQHKHADSDTNRPKEQEWKLVEVGVVTHTRSVPTFQMFVQFWTIKGFPSVEKVKEIHIVNSF